MQPSPHKRVNVVIEQLEARPVEVARQPALGDGHADARRHALSQADRWWSRRPMSIGTRDARGICCRAGGNA